MEVKMTHTPDRHPAWLARLAAKDQALFDGLPQREARRLHDYLFSVPREAGRAPGLRSLVIGLYDPFCDRRTHAMGVLWQAAPYSYCDLRCQYCYGRSYLARFREGGKEKPNFRRDLDRCLEKMDRLEVPPRHLSMANSTDLLQPRLERQLRHTRFMLERVRQYRHLFSSTCVLTKCPNVLLDDQRDLEALAALDTEVQVSVAFFRDRVAARLEPGAPPISERLLAVEQLVAQGLRVALRIDPLFPAPRRGVAELQSWSRDLQPLVEWAAGAGVSYVIGSTLKLVFRRNVVAGFNRSIQAAFPVVRGSYRRMEQQEQAELLDQLGRLCAGVGLEMEHCFGNILKRNRQAGSR
jgi:DNA repair photolyase